MKTRKTLFALAVAALPAAAAAADYLGTLKAPQSGFFPSGVYSFANMPAMGSLAAPNAADSSTRLKLGYKYSRYLAVESEFVDAARHSGDPFASPGNLTSAFRSSGYTVDTIAMLPVWHFSFYGRMGAYHGDLRNTLATSSMSLVMADNAMRGSRWRYGLGMRYDITKSLGVRAEMERYSPMGTSAFAGEAESDLFSLGVSWRF
jgi:OmpA-OmpF porin, OOP family